MAGGVRPVHPGLRGLLARPMVGYDLITDPRAVHFGVPSPGATVILAFAEPIDVGWAHDPGRSEQNWFMVAGLHTRPSLVHTHGRQCGIQLSLTPQGFRSFFGTPIGALANDLTGAAELGVPTAVHDRIAGATDWETRFDLLEAQLLSRAGDRVSTVPAELDHAWHLLGCPGARIEAVAAEVGWSRRQLQNRCRQEFGLPPKQLARVARFDRARGAVRAGLALAEAAYRFGFSDQAHLSREWSELCGLSPRRSLADDFPILQDDPRTREAR
ncbi:AraC family transcriptional regulator [Enemella evansiae]|uniref:helix-turn-helix domain-containing protein n=1 Tax=Enemella evansiae TaxID=2016499 RepID=UPI000B968451|nr:helix-turn-helix transcriptional regulator [Enemella evansiae]OYN94273.1 AraC family transcriptional regulator [Enemella evansiae]